MDGEGEFKIHAWAYSGLSVCRGITIIGFLRDRFNLRAGDPSISLVVNHFSESVI